mmetsp:Transcript_44375/g.95621  ORF Transcript_44375/g.95621 Transcript_44375/m.95621 type:complete len:86 (+) Transcript_44375:94-351(+)
MDFSDGVLGNRCLGCFPPTFQFGVYKRLGEKGLLLLWTLVVLPQIMTEPARFLLSSLGAAPITVRNTQRSVDTRGMAKTSLGKHY